MALVVVQKKEFIFGAGLTGGYAVPLANQRSVTARVSPWPVKNCPGPIPACKISKGQPVLSIHSNQHCPVPAHATLFALQPQPYLIRSKTHANPRAGHSSVAAGEAHFHEDVDAPIGRQGHPRRRHCFGQQHWSGRARFQQGDRL